MKKILKRILSIVCSITMIITSMTGFHLTNVIADTTATIILKDTEERAALVNEAANADYNFALYKNVSASTVTGGNNGGTDLSVVTNGEFATSRSASTTVTIGQKVSEDKWIQVDLGNAYDTSKIDRIAVQYYSLNTSARGGYTILYSLNGMDFVEVGSVAAYSSASGNPIICLDEIELTEEQAEEIPYAKYVRVVAKNDANNTNNGLQVMGMAVLTDGITKVSEVEYQEVETLDDPVSLTVTSSDYGQIEFSFEKAENDADDYTYYAYVNGLLYDENATPGETYTVTGLAWGDATVKIVSLKEGITSEGISRTATVKNPQNLLTDERNIAIGKSAKSSSIRESDLEANITDGSLTSLFRTATAATSASIVIDLGQNYRLDAIERTVSLYAAGRYPNSYTIDYSVNGVDFETVAEATGNSELQTVQIDSEGCTLPAVRYVRFNLSDPVGAGYGFQIYELGIIVKEDADLEPVEIPGAETLDNPVSLEVTSSDYGQLEYIFEAAAGHDDYTYYVFINGSRMEEAVLPDTQYTVSDLTAGEYEIKVISYKDGNVSEGISETVVVKDFQSLFGDERNIAVGKNATSSSIRQDEGQEPDSEVNLTDGNLTTLFRTNTADATASIVIDLGEVYKAGALERIVILFSDSRYAKEYTVECSLDGETYEQIGAATDVSSSIVSIELDATQCELTTAQFVRINLSNAVSAYGFQIYEVAVIENYIDLSEVNIELGSEFFYTGEAIEPEIVATYKDRTLVSGKDYELSYRDNTEIGNGKIIINGIGRYTGTDTKEFRIVKQNIENVTISTAFDENNDFIIGLVNGNTEMTEETDYTYEIGTDAEGNITVTFTGVGEHYTGTCTKTIMLADVPVNEAVGFVVESNALNEISVSFNSPEKLGAESQLYDVYIDDVLVDENVSADSTYTYDSQTVGTHTVKVVAVLAGKYSEGVTQEISVSGMDISSDNAEVLMEDVAPVYSGKEMIVGIIVKYGDTILECDKDYVLEYSDNINAGTAKYKVTGIGLYEGSVEGVFTIAPKQITDGSITVETGFSNKVLVVTVKDENVELTAGVDYNYVAKTDAEGNITVTITGLNGNYTGTVVKTISAKDNPNVTTPAATTTQTPTTKASEKVTAPAKAKIKKITAKKKSAKKVKLSLKKIAGADGYQVAIYKTKKNAKNNKKAIVKKIVKKVKMTVTSKKLKNQSKLFIKARAYVLDANGKKVYGKWSGVKKVAIK